MGFLSLSFYPFLDNHDEADDCFWDSVTDYQLISQLSSLIRPVEKTLYYYDLDIIIGLIFLYMINFYEKEKKSCVKPSLFLKLLIETEDGV